MKRRLYELLLIIVCILFVICISVCMGQKDKDEVLQDSSYHTLEAPMLEDDPLKQLDDDYYARNHFTSNLPLVILDMNGEEPPIHTKYNREEERHIRIPGVEPYITGVMSVIDGGKVRTLSDEPSVSSEMIIKRRGNSSMKYEKAQYLVKLKNEQQDKNPVSLLGMSAHDEWVLNGSMTDRSMMRNYLCYRITSQILPYTVEYNYCEVFIKDERGYRYQGVYLLGENVRQGEGRVDIEKAKKSKEYCSYILRRDRYDDEAVNLDTWATREKLTYGQIEVIYPGKRSVTRKQKDYIKNDIEKIEKILYADDESVFRSYPEYLDVDSFVDYFIINEYFGNYDAGKNSTYMYKNLVGKLCIGPVWDFDGAIDNYYRTRMKIEALSFYTAPWFDRLVLDREFMRRVQKRYIRLRKEILSDDSVYEMIDETSAYLKNASVREWKRWSYDEYNPYSLRDYEDTEGDIIYRESTVYEKELYKLKTVLHKHGAAMPAGLKLLEEQAVFNSGWDHPMIWIVCCVLIFLIPIFYVAVYR